jgi:hypothetical protein
MSSKVVELSRRGGRPLGVALDVERARFAELRRRLLELYPDLDDQTLADTLEGATNLHEALGSLIRSALDDEMMAAALRDRVATMRARLDRLAKRAAEKRQLAGETMEGAQISKLIEADFTASLRQGAATAEVTDETKLPLEFLIPQPAKPDRRAILEALNSGLQVSGAALCVPRPSLSVRSQ